MNDTDLQEQKEEMNQVIHTTIEDTIKSLKKAKSAEQERISLVAFAHIWMSQVTLYFDHLFYSGIPVLDLEESEIQLYLVAESKSCAYTLIGLGRMESFFNAQVEMVNAFKRCLAYMDKHFTYEHRSFLEALTVEITVFINSTFDQYIKSFYFIRQSSELLKKYADKEDRPSIHDMRFKLVDRGNNDIQFFGFVAHPEEKKPKTEDDPIQVVSSKDAVSDSPTNETDEEDDWQ